MASPRHFWGAELRAQRDACGLPLNDLGKLVHRDSSYLAKIERGDRNIPADLVSDCD
ncbi:MAG: helix-turn-helix domain-containing protein [Pseudonocardiales bacterium]